MRYLSYINGIEFIAVDNLIEAIDIFKSGKFERSSSIQSRNMGQKESI